ncbi:hypothetical protein GCM10027088_16070 [Nocardia goodfellowii]
MGTPCRGIAESNAHPIGHAVEIVFEQMPVVVERHHRGLVLEPGGEVAEFSEALAVISAAPDEPWDPDLI